VKAFLDTSVLVAAFYGDHEHHDASVDVFLRFGKHKACCGAHSLAEVYSVLTGMPGKDRVSGDEALLFLGNIRERLTIVTLNEEEYCKAIEAAAAAGISGGGIYDALLGHCAVIANADTIYTWNVKHFRRIWHRIADRVRTP
jgi:predicted nucleic acid-binding protein